ncbi:MAG: hypothetical protein V1793_01175 [Pseudomonadota bacterium]
MIVFCEECGQKQPIVPDQICSGILDYTCLFCGFHNFYPVPVHRSVTVPEARTDNRQFHSADLQILQKIRSLPEVKGVFLVHQGTEVLVTPTILPDFPQRDLKKLGELLAASCHLGRDRFPDMNELFLAADDSVILCHWIVERFFLAIVLKRLPASGQLRHLGEKAALNLAKARNDHFRNDTIKNRQGLSG